MASISIIPHDVIVKHILRRLPSKSVGLCRCVSKEWLSSLSDPQFIKSHQKTINRTQIMIGYPEFPSYWPRSEPLQTKVRLGLFDIDIRHGSVNGLVLGSTHSKLTDVYTLTVLNPTTGDYVHLPFNKQVDVSGLLGFGYDSVTDDYKVVNITSTHENYRSNVHVFSLRTNTWKQVTDLPYNLYDKRLSGVFVNGFLHWIVSNRSERVIVAFSLADEKFSELSSPPSSLQHNEIHGVNCTRLVEVGEKLAMFHTEDGPIWLMNEYGVHKSWTKIVVDRFNESPYGFCGDASTTVFYEKGKVVIVRDGIFWIYDVEEQTLCQSVDLSHRCHRDMKFRYVTHAFVESLVSPKFSTSI